MSRAFAHSHHMPCAECGASVAADQHAEHVCDPERRLEYRLFQLKDEVARLEDGLREYLESPQGRFAQYMAEHERRRKPSAG